MTAVGRLAHLLVPGASPRSRHVVGRNLRWFRARAWIVVSGFFEPLFYLLALGVGVGQLVGTIEYRGAEVDYDVFVAPAMLAASAFNGAIFDSTINIFAKLKWQKTYDAMIATPLTPGDIAMGELGTSQLRGLLYSTAFLLTMLVLGLVQSWWAILAVPVGLLIGASFAAAGLASATYMRSWQDFEYVLIVQLPLFLFSTTFYPLDTYPPALQWIVQATPLYHGVDLMRQLVLGQPTWSALVHVAYLLAMLAVGIAIAGRRFHQLLTK
ncbi:MAG: ABC transporter permease [Actinomycetota bacterium]